MLRIAGGGTGSDEQEAEMGGSLGQRDRQTPRRLSHSKNGGTGQHTLSARDGWGSGKNWGLGRRSAPVRALPPVLRVALSIPKSKMRRQDGSLILWSWHRTPLSLQMWKASVGRKKRTASVAHQMGWSMWFLNRSLASALSIFWLFLHSPLSRVEVLFLGCLDSTLVVGAPLNST